MSGWMSCRPARWPTTSSRPCAAAGRRERPPPGDGLRLTRRHRGRTEIGDARVAHRHERESAERDGRDAGDNDPETGEEPDLLHRQDPGPPTIILISSRDAAGYGGRIGRSGARGFIGKAGLSAGALAAVLTGAGADTPPAGDGPARLHRRGSRRLAAHAGSHPRLWRLPPDHHAAC